VFGIYFYMYRQICIGQEFIVLTIFCPHSLVHTFSIFPSHSYYSVNMAEDLFNFAPYKSQKCKVIMDSMSRNAWYYIRGAFQKLPVWQRSGCMCSYSVEL
jgi:hypothetical protein